MRNYYATLQSDQHASVFELNEKLQKLDTLEPELAAKARRILLDTEKKEVYDKVHLQFEAIALAYTEFANRPVNGDSDFQDTNKWDRRLVEFASPQSDDETDLFFSTLDNS